MMVDRYTRYSPLHGVSGNGHRCRYSRYTPLEGCNGVTLAQMVPMPQNLCGQETGGWGHILTHTGGLADG